MPIPSQEEANLWCLFTGCIPAPRGIKAPVAVLVGNRDPVRNLYVTPLSRVRKDWSIVVIEGAGHLDCIVKAQFKDELKKWLDKNARR